VGGEMSEQLLVEAVGSGLGDPVADAFEHDEPVGVTYFSVA
jgi:hypothetical protein